MNLNEFVRQNVFFQGLLVLAAIITLLWLCSKLLGPQAISLRDKHVVVVGGSSGIGLCLAMQAAKEGAVVSIVARDLNRLDDARAAIGACSTVKGRQNVFSVSADVSGRENADAAVQVIAGVMGSVDVLILSQGYANPGTFWDVKVDSMRSVMDCNFWGGVHTVKAALERMKEGTPSEPRCICFVSSILGQVGLYGYSSYAASKFALRGLAEALQQELSHKNIRVSLAYPPDTDTPGYAEENKTKPEVSKILAEGANVMKPEDVARQVLRGIKRGDFHISCNFEGWMVKILTAGFSPEPHLLAAVMQVLLMGPLRIMGLFYQMMWFGVIKNWNRVLKKTS